MGGAAKDSWLRNLMWQTVAAYSDLWTRFSPGLEKMAMGILEISPSESALAPLFPSERSPQPPQHSCFSGWLLSPSLTSLYPTGPSFPVGSLPLPFQLYLFISWAPCDSATVIQFSKYLQGPTCPGHCTRLGRQKQLEAIGLLLKHSSTVPAKPA